MAITSLYLAESQPAPSITAQIISLTESWILITDTFTTPAGVVSLLLANDGKFGFPRIGDVNSALPSVVATKYTPKLASTSYTQYVVSVDFSNSSSNIQNSLDPKQVEPSYVFDWVDSIQVIDTDTDDARPIINSAGTPVILTENRPSLKLTIVRNESDFDHKLASQHIGRVNSSKATILGKSFDKRTMKLDRWSGAAQYDVEGELYWKVTYEILIRDPKILSLRDGQALGFRREFLNVGTVNVQGNKPAGLEPSKEYKLDITGNFFTIAEQIQKEKTSYEVYSTLYESNWTTQIGFKSRPSTEILGLTGGGFLL